jgi:hypothetical protein
MPKPETPEVLEARRARGRARAKKFRDRIKERADDQIAQALTKLTGPAFIPAPMHDLADQTARALLKRTCDRYGVDVEGIVRPIGEALHAQRVRKLKRKVVLAPDFQSQLRASELGSRLLERVGAVPDAKSSHSGPITVNVLVIPEEAE